MQLERFNIVSDMVNPTYQSPWVAIYKVDEENVLAASGTTTEGLSYEDEMMDGSEANESFTSGGSQLEW